MLGSRAVAIELGRKRLCALQASFRRSGVVVRRMLIEPLPADLSRTDPEALGKWLAETLRKADMPTARAAIALSRDEVIVKRLTLPTTVDAELPDMTRLAVSRDLPFDAEQAVIDFVPLERTETSTTVLALAMPRAELEAAQRVYKAAGIEADRVSLRAMGAAALLASVPGLKREPTLIIDITGERIEFGVVVGGAIRFSRAADLPNGDSSVSLTETIITETRRTWLSYRIGDDTDGVRQVIMIGDESAAESAAESIAGILNISPVVLHAHPQIERGHLRLGAAWPLAGLLLEQQHQEHVIDMAHPRKPPDVHAQLRLRVLAGAAVLIAVCGVAFTFLRADLRRLETQAAQLKEQYQPLEPEYWRIVRDFNKLEHLEQWRAARVDWLDHLNHLVGLMPARDQLVLDDFAGSLKIGKVRIDRDSRKWSTPTSVHISVQGEAKDRVLADLFRQAILGAARYSVTTPGPEREGGQRFDFPFNYKLLVQGAGDGETGGEHASAPDQHASATKLGEAAP